MIRCQLLIQTVSHTVPNSYSYLACPQVPNEIRQQYPNYPINRNTHRQTDKPILLHNPARRSHIVRLHRYNVFNCLQIIQSLYIIPPLHFCCTMLILCTESKKLYWQCTNHNELYTENLENTTGSNINQTSAFWNNNKMERRGRQVTYIYDTEQLILQQTSPVLCQHSAQGHSRLFKFVLTCKTAAPIYHDATFDVDIIQENDSPSLHIFEI